MPLKPLPEPGLAIAGTTPPAQGYAEYFAALDQLLRSAPAFPGPDASDSNAAGHAISVANFLAGVLLRSGPAGAFSDTTPTAAEIVSNIPKAVIGSNRLIGIANSGGGLMTLLAGTGVTLAGTTTVASGNTRFYLVKATAVTPGAEAVSVRGLFTAAQ